MLGLTRVEVGGDVAVLAAEDGEQLLPRADLEMHVVGERDVAEQHTVQRGDHGDIVGDQSVGRVRHDAGERRRRD